jgi:DNA polymerase I-like protein with 3'-5' exonuclease and polymerase domains
MNRFPSLRDEPEIRLDCETDGTRWEKGNKPVGFALWRPRANAGSYYGVGHVSGNDDPAQVREYLRAELAGKHITNHTTKFDIHMSRNLGIDLVALGCTFGDVAHNAALLDDNRYTFNLDQLASDFLGIDDAKADTLPNGTKIDKTRMASYPAELIAPYAIRDVELVELLERHTRPLLAEQDLMRVYQLENDVIPVVVEMESNGFPINVPLLERWCGETKQELEDTIYKIWRLTGIKFDGIEPTLFETERGDAKFTNDRMRALFRVRGIKIPLGKNDKNELVESFADDLLEKIPDEAVQLLRYGMQLRSLRSKFLVKMLRLVDKNGIIRYGLHQLASDDGGTVSGRFSSSGKNRDKSDWGINAQQIFSIDNQLKTLVARWPVRLLFIAGAGDVLAADAKQIEYRLFANDANSPRINAVYAENPDADFHDTVMHILQEEIEINRKHTKNVNFACVFGAGLGRFAEMCDLVDGYEMKEFKGNKYLAPIPNERAVKLYNTYMRTFPEVKPLLEKAAALASPVCDCRQKPCRYVDRRTGESLHRGYVRTGLGRRARFPHGGRTYSALNRRIQGTAASINKRKLVDVYKNRHALELVMRVTNHDEIVGDLLNRSKVRMIAELLDTQIPLGVNTRGEPVMSRIPILWDTKTAPSWAMNYKDKYAKAFDKGEITGDVWKAIQAA